MSTRIGIAAATLAGVALLFPSLSGRLAWGYTLTLTPDGIPVRWSGGERLNLAGNSRTRTSQNGTLLRPATVRGLQRWVTASGGGVGFQYWEGTGSKYVANSDYDGRSSLYFASNHSRGKSGLDAAVIGLTQVWYDRKTGKILESDIVLNDVHYEFTNDPRDTSGFGSDRRNTGTRPKIFLDNVLTHELGHAFGLSHSAILQSTMLYVEAPEQAFLACDDQTGIRAAYNEANKTGHGVLLGRVVDMTNRPIFGAQVIAISASGGFVVGGVLTDKNGMFRFNALPADSYALQVEPFLGSPATLPPYYSGISTRVCQGGHFERQVVADEEGGHRARLAPVTANGVHELGDVAIHCSLPESGGGNNWGSGPELNENGKFAWFDRDPGLGGDSHYRLTWSGGDLRLQALSYTLYSPRSYQIELRDELGNTLVAQSGDRVDQGASGYVNFDTALLAPSLPAGLYSVKVAGSIIAGSRYPGGSSLVDLDPTFLLIGNSNLNAGSGFPRCRMNENFPPYQSPAGDPPVKDIGDPDTKPGGCGTISIEDGSSNGPGSGFGMIMGWMIPYLMAFVALRMQRGGLRLKRGAVTLQL